MANLITAVVEAERVCVLIPGASSEVESRYDLPWTDCIHIMNVSNYPASIRDASP